MTDTATDDRTMTKEETAGIALLKRYAKNPDGEEILRRFADSIQVANRFERKQWVPTARKMKGWTVNLRTGQIYALTLKRDEVQILLLPQMLGAEERKALEEAQHHKYEPKHPPGSARYTLDLPKARKLWGLIENAHHAVLRHRRHTSGAKAPEADALIDALRDELKLELPYPDRGVVDSGGEDDAPSNQGPPLLEEHAASADVSVASPTTDDCLRLLTRREIPRGQIQLYRALLAAGPEGATTSELIATMGRDDREDLYGVLGALGNRVNGTDGYGATHKPGNRMVLDVEEAEDGHGMRYRLKSVMRDALAVHAPSWIPEDLLPPPPLANCGRFSDLLRTLDEEGLLFSAETVANYVLALQTKRFAILTGISGTGKTQIAMALARSFPATIRDHAATEPENAAALEDATRMIARPFHFKYRQIVLPVAFVAEVDHMLTPDSNSNGGHITVAYPDGHAKLRFWRDPNPSRNVTWLMFAAAHDFRDWYFDSLQSGDHYYIRPRESEQPDAPRIEFQMAETTVEERDLDNTIVVPVRPDWVDNRGLMGYLNPITGTYAMTPFLSLLLEARDEERRADKEGRDPHPFFVVLDEMNLARVEHYFSDFLSALESGEPIPLHDSEEVEEGGTESESGTVVPRKLRVPDNVFFTGTVNVDETTYMFSPKVLDRAFTIEFDLVDLAGYTEGVASESGELDLSAGKDGALRFTPYEKPDRDDWLEFTNAHGRYAGILQSLHAVLEEEHRHFGYRVANEIARFVNLAHAQSGGDAGTVRAAFDLALRQKVLPKFHGTQQELERILRRLFNFAVTGKDGGPRQADVTLDDWRAARGRLSWAGEQKPTPGGAVPAGTPGASADGPAASDDDGTEDSTTTAAADSAGTEADASEGTAASATAGSESRDPEFPRTAAKLWRMLKRLEQRGFTAFIE